MGPKGDSTRHLYFFIFSGRIIILMKLRKQSYRETQSSVVFDVLLMRRIGTCASQNFFHVEASEGDEARVPVPGIS